MTGPLSVETDNLAGDEQADLTVHGGPDKAVCVYSADHFPEWSRVLREGDLGAGAFGENFSVSHMDETSVCVGDVYAVGTSLVQVSQPRSPCWKLAARWNRPDLPRLVLQSGRTGWYFRVLQRGVVSAGEELSLSDRPCGEWSIAPSTTSHTPPGATRTLRLAARWRPALPSPSRGGRWLLRALSARARQRVGGTNLTQTGAPSGDGVAGGRQGTRRLIDPENDH